MARQKVLSDIETEDLEIGDAVVWNDGTIAIFQGRDAIVGSDYETIFWGEAFDGPTWQSTARPWDVWPAAIRIVQS